MPLLVGESAGVLSLRSSFLSTTVFFRSAWLTNHLSAESREQVDTSDKSQKYKIGNWVLERVKLVELDWDKDDSEEVPSFDDLCFVYKDDAGSSVSDSGRSRSSSNTSSTTTKTCNSSCGASKEGNEVL